MGATISPYFKEIGRRIRIARGSMSLEELSSRIGVSAQHLSRLERGERKIPLDLLQEIAKEVNQPLAFFLLEDWPDISAPDIEEVLSRLSVGAVPVYGPVDAGQPFAMEQATEYKIFPLELMDAATMAITIRGNKLRDIGIQDGDMLLIRRQTQANAGDIVVRATNGEMIIERMSEASADVYARVIKIVRSV